MAQTWYLKEKFAFIQQEGPSLANFTKENLLKISTYFIFGNWQGAGLNSKFA